MVKSKKQELIDASSRRRGRPIGKNRVPLSREERRARNALYERERRIDMTMAMQELAEAIGCKENTSNAEILANSIVHIRKGTVGNKTIKDYKRQNKILEAQIMKLSEELALQSERLEDDDSMSSEDVTLDALTEDERRYIFTLLDGQNLND